MKHFIKYTLILGLGISSMAVAQTKYSSLNDACSRNANGSGVSNNSKAIFIPLFNTNEYAFLNNDNRSFRRLGANVYYNPVANAAFQTNNRGKITIIQSCGSVVGSLQIQNTYAKGLSGDSNFQIDNEGSLWHNEPSNETWSNMSISFVPSTNRIAVAIDMRGWGDGCCINDLRFKVELSPTWYTKAQLEAIDFSNQKGRKVSIIGALFDASGNIEESKQSIINIGGDLTSQVPTFFKTPTNRRIGSPSIFPNFSLTGKTNIINYGSLDATLNYENHQYLDKGYSVVTKKGNPVIPNNKTMFSEYDNWATDNGCPSSSGGVNRQASAVVWLATTPMNQLYSYYQSVISAASSNAVLFHDFEAFGYEILNNQTACNKLASLHRAFRLANPNCLMTSYINAKPIDIAFSADISSAQMIAENAKYNQPFSALAKGFYAKQIQYLDVNTGAATPMTGYMSDNLGLGIVGDYNHRYNESGFYAFVEEMELAKIHQPNKLLVSLFWSYIETLPSGDIKDINTIRRYYKKSNGFVYQNDYKMAVPFSEMYNRALWSNFIVSGQWLWHDPHNSVNGFDYHGGNAKNVVTGVYIKDNAPNQFVNLTNLGSMEISTTLGYDYNQLALYELSLNNDIMSQATQTIDFSTDNGSTYYSGDDLKPASAEYKRLPIVRIKKHPTLNEWLVLAMNKHLPHFQNQTIKIRIDGKTVDILLNGQYSKLERIKLI